MSKPLMVVKIIDEYNVVINGGKNAGLKEDNLLEIIGPGEEIIDPFTGQVLGILDSIKALIKITRVHEHMSECRSATVIHRPGLWESSLPTTSASEAMKQLIQPSTKLAPLNVDPAEISGKKTNNEPIKIGDLVRQKS